MNVPDVAGVIKGFRLWEVKPSGHLDSTGTKYVWVPGENEAICYADPEHFQQTVWKNVDGELQRVLLMTHGLIPEQKCNCGFWMFHRPEEAIKEFFRPKRDSFFAIALWATSEPRVRHYALGEVCGWGGVIQAKRGFRAEYARVERLISIRRKDMAPYSTLEKAAARYNVPLEAWDYLDEGETTPRDLADAIRVAG